MYITAMSDGQATLLGQKELPRSFTVSELQRLGLGAQGRTDTWPSILRAAQLFAALA